MRNHGFCRTESIAKRMGGWAYQMRELGYNYRVTDFQCALGLSQLEKIDSFLKRRREIAVQYNRAFSERKDRVRLPEPSMKDRKHAFHLYLFRLKLESSKLNRRKLYEILRTKGIMAQVHYMPVYHHPFYKRILGRNYCPNAEKYYTEVLSLPIFPGLLNQEAERVIRIVQRALGDYQ